MSSVRHFFPRKSPVFAKNPFHSGGYAGYFLELPGCYQSSRERQNSVPRRRRDLVSWAPARKDRSSNVSTSNFLLSIYEAWRKFLRKVCRDIIYEAGGQSSPPSELIRAREIEVQTSLFEEENCNLLFEPFYQSSSPPTIHDTDSSKHWTNSFQRPTTSFHRIFQSESSR